MLECLISRSDFSQCPAKHEAATLLGHKLNLDFLVILLRSVRLHPCVASGMSMLKLWLHFIAPSLVVQVGLVGIQLQHFLLAIDVLGFPWFAQYMKEQNQKEQRMCVHTKLNHTACALPARPTDSSWAYHPLQPRTQVCEYTSRFNLNLPEES